MYFNTCVFVKSNSENGHVQHVWMFTCPGNELIQYNPSEDLPSIFDLQDIPPVTDTEGNHLTEQNADEETLNTPLVTPLDGDRLRIANTATSRLKIKQEMEDVD